jgi:spore maturation protein CgeB
MKRRLKITLFSHSLVSDWNHGNVHFLRGLVRELVRLGHQVRCYEELGGWSLASLIQHEGEQAFAAIDQFRAAYPELEIRFYQSTHPGFREFLDRQLKNSDLALLHEWNDPMVVNSVLELRRRRGFIALFYDSHHRAYSQTGEILKFHLHLADGVLAFGEALRRIYAERLGVRRTWTFHEAADVSRFCPQARRKEIDLLWIGNWGDDERSQELQEFLIGPAAALPRRRVVVHGVRYPASALAMLKEVGVEFRGYLCNLQAADVYAASTVALHVPRRYYANGLSGIPTIRVFEALACGVPLLCSPWNDEENLFCPGQDYLVAPDGKALQRQLENLLCDEAARRRLAEHGVKTIRERHTCAHRAEQLLSIYEELAA